MTKRRTPSKFRERLCIRLGDEFDRCGKRQCDVARESGLTEGCVSQVLCGHAMPSVFVLSLICRATGISADVILGLRK